MKQQHAGDCTFYSSIINQRPYDGICTCGYGWQRVRLGTGDESELVSKERAELERQIDRAILARSEALWKAVEEVFKPKGDK